MECEEFTAVGSNYLDSFDCKKVEVIDEYFTCRERERLSNSMFSFFCFPKGLKVRLIPCCALKGANRLGWCGDNSDKYELLQFTNELGSTVHGLSITTNEMLYLRNLEKFRKLRNQRRLARLVSRLWRRFAKNEKNADSIVSKVFLKIVLSFFCKTNSIQGYWKVRKKMS